MVSEMRELAKVHGISKAFALFVPDGTELADVDASSVQKRWTQVLVKGKPQTDLLRVVPLASDLPQLPLEPLLQGPAVPEVGELTALRVTIVKDFVPYDDWRKANAHPQRRLASAWPPQCRGLHSAYGWRRTFKPGASQGPDDAVLVEGFVKLACKDVDTILRASGQQGVFFDRLASGQLSKPPVQWLPKLKDEDLFTYGARASAEAAKRQRGLAFRRGGGSRLGVRLQDGDDRSQLADAIALWRVSVPKTWTVQLVESYLTSAKWGNVVAVSPPRGRRRGWLVRATLPDGIDRGTPVLTIATPDGGGISIAKVTRSKRDLLQVPCRAAGNPLPRISATETRGSATAPAQPLPGASSGASAVARTSSAAAAASPSENADMGAAAKRLADATPAPAAKKTCGVSSASDGPGGFALLDLGGGGACGYNCLATGLAWKSGAEAELKKKADVAGKTLRVEIQSHIRKHAQTYAPLWAVDSAWTETSEGGSVAGMAVQSGAAGPLDLWDDSCRRSAPLGSHHHRASSPQQFR
jgi:hypothetical protein